MKKLFGLIFVLALALCLATTAFAASVVTADMWDPTVATVVTVPADGTAKVTVMNSGFDLLISGKGEYTVTYNGQSVEIAGGVATVEDVEATRFMPATVVIKNLSGAEATYTLIGRYALGAWCNPAQLQMGENVAEIEAGMQSYYLEWTAPASGVLTVTMPTDMDWFFTYSNFGADREDCLGDFYGEDHFSTNGDNVFEIQVKNGDLLELQVNTYDPEDVYNTPAGTVTFSADLEVEHANVIHFDAVEPGCHYDGNIEYWFCADCEGFWQNAELTQLTNSKRVILPATGGEVKHVEATEPACHRPGNIEYWYCAECEQYWQNEALTQLTNSKRVKIAAEVTLEYHKAVAATCEENGMAEYWYCAECDAFFTDCDGIFNIAYKSLTTPATGHNIVDGECTECGNANTGDAGIMSVVVTMLASAMGTVALIAKKKEF